MGGSAAVYVLVGIVEQSVTIALQGADGWLTPQGACVRSGLASSAAIMTGYSHGSRRHHRQFSQSHQVVVRDGSFPPTAGCGRLRDASAPTTTHRLHTAEDLFNPLPGPLAGPVTLTREIRLQRAEHCSCATRRVVFELGRSSTKRLVP